MIYIIVFILSLIFISIALNFRNKNKIIFIFISTIALFIPAALAGLRNYNIGTDVNVYIEPLFSVAKHFNSFKIYITSTGSEINDILYLLMTFICRKLTEDIFLLFFTTQLLVIYPIYKALIIINKNKISILIGMFIYFMLFYNVSLNMARQSIAISFSLLSFAHFITDNKKKSILNLIIASFFIISPH